MRFSIGKLIWTAEIWQYNEEKEKLENEINSRRAAWEEEELTRDREQKETEDNFKKQRQQEIEEHEYRKALEQCEQSNSFYEAMILVE